MKLEAVQSCLDGLSGTKCVALVGGGYLAALLTAILVLITYVHVTSGPDRDASSGMYAFGDALFFLVVLAAGSVAPTGLMLYFLRRLVAPWKIFSAVGMVISLTGLLAVWNIAQRSNVADVWSLLAVPRVFLAPLLLGLFVLVGIFSPGWSNRKWLLAAAGLECLTSAYGFVHWFVPALVR